MTKFAWCGVQVCLCHSGLALLNIRELVSASNCFWIFHCIPFYCSSELINIIQTTFCAARLYYCSQS